MRERGLKHFFSVIKIHFAWSLPMRERGLKLQLVSVQHSITESLPMRERGLKLFRDQCQCPFPQVAPHAGAWVETCYGTK